MHELKLNLLAVEHVVSPNLLERAPMVLVYNPLDRVFRALEQQLVDDRMDVHRHYIELPSFNE